MKKKYYISYVFTTEQAQTGFGGVGATFEHDIPTVFELHDLAERLKEDYGFKSVGILCFNEVFNDDQEVQEESER